MSELERLQGEFLRLLSRVPEADWEVPSTIGGGDWSVRDLVGHVASWERRALEAIEAARSGQTITLEEGGLDEVNERSLRRDRGLTLDELRRSAAQTHSQLIEEIGTLDDATWESGLEVGSVGRDPLSNVVAQLTGADDHPFGHLTAHLPDLAAYVESLPGA